MARIRSIKPEFFADQDLAVELPNRDARLLYIGLWGLADEHARLRGDPASLKGQLFPYDPDLTPEVIDALLDLLEATGRVARYRVRSSIYLHLPKLAAHQRLEPHKVPSRLPEPPAGQPEHHEPKPSEKIPDEPAPPANKSAPKQAASSRKQVAGSSARGADPPRRNPAPHSLDQAARLIVDATGVTPELAVEVARTIALQRRPRNLAGLVRSIINADDLGEWFTHTENKINARTAGGAGRDPPACPHGQPAGLEPITSTGKPRCPHCRAGAPQ